MDFDSAIPRFEVLAPQPGRPLSAPRQLRRYGLVKKLHRAAARGRHHRPLAGAFVAVDPRAVQSWG